MNSGQGAQQPDVSPNCTIKLLAKRMLLLVAKGCAQWRGWCRGRVSYEVKKA